MDSATVSVGVLPLGSGRAQRGRRAAVDSRPPVPVAVGAPLPSRFRGKGAAHANACAGPWASALEAMPPPPLTGAKRARAGLADVDLPQRDVKRLARERSARALVAILPRSVAEFILHDPPDAIAARSDADNAERLVEAVSSYGHTAVDKAAGALGRLLTDVRRRHPTAPVVLGSHVRDFMSGLDAHSRHTVSTGLTWLRDHLGCDLPVRAPVMRPYRRGTSTGSATSRSKAPFTLEIVLGLEEIAATHHSPFVRGHAAGWHALALFLLRQEQGRAMAVNAILDHSYDGESFSVVVAAVEADKNPNPENVRPRPAWAILDGLLRPGAVLAALRAMLSGHESVMTLLLDTDSPSGDPLEATRWVRSPVPAHRDDASIQALLRLPPISMTAAEAAVFHGHSPKRFLLCCAESHPGIDATFANELGRFSGSTAQSDDLEPVQAMLRAHALRCAVLPDIYAGKARVGTAFDRLARMQRVLRSAALRARADPSLLSRDDPWAVFRSAPDGSV